jgi:hypothetical protein
MQGFGTPRRLARPLAIALAVAEATIAVFVIPAGTARVAALAAAGLFATFAVVVAAARLRGRAPDCHCFGRLHSAPAGWAVVARNVALAALAAAVASQQASAIGATEVVVFAVAALVVGQAALVLTLFRRYGRALKRIEELEIRIPRVGPRQIGAEAQPQEGARSGNGKVTLAGAAAGAVAVTSAVAQAASQGSSALDPELQAIDAAFKAGLQRLAAASNRSSKAVHAYATTRPNAPQVARRRTAAVQALASERREVLALRGRIKDLAATGNSAKLVKQRLLAGLSLMAGSLDHHRRALPATPAKAASLLATSQRLRVDSLVPFATAAQIMVNER